MWFGTQTTVNVTIITANQMGELVEQPDKNDTCGCHCAAWHHLPSSPRCCSLSTFWRGVFHPDGFLRLPPKWHPIPLSKWHPIPLSNWLTIPLYRVLLSIGALRALVKSSALDRELGTIWDIGSDTRQTAGQGQRLRACMNVPGKSLVGWTTVSHCKLSHMCGGDCCISYYGPIYWFHMGPAMLAFTDRIVPTSQV